MKHKISFCLIAIGILIASVPFTGALYYQYRQQLLYQSYLEDIHSHAFAGNAADRDGDADDASRHMSESDQIFEPFSLKTAAGGLSLDGNLPVIEGEPPTKSNKKEEEPTVLGRISIEKINADLMLVEGAGAKELKWGAGHIKGTGVPGEHGNCAIAAHRNYTFGSYFSRLNELEQDDRVTVSYLGETFHYRVSDIKTVLPEDNTVLQPPEEGEILTLVTCAPKGSNRLRLIVHCLPEEDPFFPATSGEALPQL